MWIWRGDKKSGEVEDGCRETRECKTRLKKLKQRINRDVLSNMEMTLCAKDARRTKGAVSAKLEAPGGVRGKRRQWRSFDMPAALSMYIMTMNTT